MPPRSSGRTASAELTDFAEREQARHSDAALVAYESKWRRKLTRLQRSYPERWCVPGLSDEEVRDLLCLRLVEALRGADEPLLALHAPGREWGLLVARHELRLLRRGFRLKITPCDFVDSPTRRQAPDQEQGWLDAEEEHTLALAQRLAEQQLSRPQRQWLSAFKLSARAGGIFESSSEPNLSAASRLLGKNRSSAQRAYRELQARFSSELARLK